MVTGQATSISPALAVPCGASLRDSGACFVRWTQELATTAVYLSAFSLQTLSLFQQGDWFRGSGYIGASVLLCVVGVWAGYALATAINPASSSGW
jgi:hypothetical protein